MHLQPFTMIHNGFTIIHNHSQSIYNSLQCIYNHLQWFTIHLQSFTIHLQPFTIDLQPFTIHLHPFTIYLQSIYNHSQFIIYNHLQRCQSTLAIVYQWRFQQCTHWLWGTCHTSSNSFESYSVTWHITAIVMILITWGGSAKASRRCCNYYVLLHISYSDCNV